MLPLKLIVYLQIKYTDINVSLHVTSEIACYTVPNPDQGTLPVRTRRSPSRPADRTHWAPALRWWRRLRTAIGSYRSSTLFTCTCTIKQNDTSHLSPICQQQRFATLFSDLLHCNLIRPCRRALLNFIIVFFLKKFLLHTCPFAGHWYPCLGLLVDVSYGLQSQSGFYCIHTWQRHTWYTFPEIHLWCYTFAGVIMPAYWPVTFPTCLLSRGGMPGFEPPTVWCTTHSATATDEFHNSCRRKKISHALDRAVWLNFLIETIIN